MEIIKPLLAVDKFLANSTTKFLHFILKNERVKINSLMKKNILLFVLLLGLCTQLLAQITTSALTGFINDDNGEPLLAATVKATHLPSGTIFGGITQESGRYIINNMRIGGPYAIEVSYLGYATEKIEGIYLTLGQQYNQNFTLKETEVTGSEVVIVDSKDPILNSERTGAATSLSRAELDRLPTISRSAADYTRLNTMAAEGGSFAGRNDQFNNYSLDGAIFNNPFGLDAATPGGQIDAQPVSLDAIEQISVEIAPYDVSYSGFTGASINSVSKSGTNELKGTVFGFFRNAAMTGGKVGGQDIFKGDPSQSQFGFSLGGPIVKNKIFFFANMEREDRTDLGSLWVPNGTANESGNVARVHIDDMQMVSDLLMQTYDYDTGDTRDFLHEADNTKGLLKLDFNLSDQHKLMASYNFLSGYKDKPAHPSALGRRGPDFQTLQFENSGYRINNLLHQFRAELRSIFNNKISNKFTAAYTQFRDHREPKSSPFPVVNISKDGIRYIIAGHEPFSINNVLDQDAFQLKNELSYFSDRHNISGGIAFERFDFNNSFNLGVYGGSAFAPDIPIESFQTVIDTGGLDGLVAAAANTFETNRNMNSWALAETNAGQFSIYAQDEIALNQQLNITVGLRIDVPLYFNTATKIQENLERNCCYDPEVQYYDEAGNGVKFDHTTLPSSTPLINPRIGFNYDVRGDRTQQLRGGTGLFSGRFPYVWVGNQVANPNAFFYNMTDPNYKYPQIWRTSLGYDQQFGEGWIGTIDMVYTKDQQAQVVNNFGLQLPTQTLEGVENRPIYGPNDRLTNAYVFTNVNGGSSFNTSLSVERNWNNTYIKLGYNFLNATDVMSIDAEISSDAYERNPANIEHTNRPLVSPSLYGNRHRIVGTASKRFNWGNPRFGTTATLFFEYVEGGRYSYTYAGDINNDGSNLNDLLYIPTDAEIDQMTFGGDNAGEQATALKSFIVQDAYLSNNRGSYAEKYGALSPWYNTWDVRILQDIGINDKQKFQLSFDVLNVGNLINSNWGVRQLATNTSLFQPIAVSVTDGEPVYNFDSRLTETFQNDFSVNSRWRLQMGLRFVF